MRSTADKKRLSDTEMQSWSLISVDYHLYYCLYSLIQVRLRQVKFFLAFLLL